MASVGRNLGRLAGDPCVDRDDARRGYAHCLAEPFGGWVLAEMGPSGSAMFLGCYRQFPGGDR